jgi:glycosyltransferase involved in cell wall biosynthesis
MYWVADYEMKGNGYGYTTHQKSMRAALERAGVVMTPESDLAIHIVTPPSFKPIPGKFNVLFTMYEMASLPPDWPDKVNLADLILVPCKHNRELFRRYTNLPIEIVWEGIDPSLYKLRKREFPEGKFVYLWVGASNPRKGTEHISHAWGMFWQAHPELHGKVHLILKTTQPNNGERCMDMSKIGCTFDTRDYSKQELFELYDLAHCFVFPSMGEGWGLTLHEAMATGLPAIYTRWSAMDDWVPHKFAYQLKHGMRMIDTLRCDTGERHHSAPAAFPDIQDLARRMYYVYTHYEEAAHKGYQGGLKVREITWDRAARELIDKVYPHHQAWREHGCKDHDDDGVQREVRDVSCLEDRAFAYDSP